MTSQGLDVGTWALVGQGAQSLEYREPLFVRDATEVAFPPGGEGYRPGQGSRLGVELGNHLIQRPAPLALGHLGFGQAHRTDVLWGIGKNVIQQLVFVDGDEGSDGVPPPRYQGRSASSSHLLDDRACVVGQVTDPDRCH